MPLTRSRSSLSHTPSISVVVGVYVTGKQEYLKTSKRKSKKASNKPFEIDKGKDKDKLLVKEVPDRELETSRLVLRAASESTSSDVSTLVSTKDLPPEKYTLADALQLMRHPDALAVEPYRVFCAKCLEWVTMTAMFHLATFRIHTTSICKRRNMKEKHVEKGDITVINTSTSSSRSVEVDENESDFTYSSDGMEAEPDSSNLDLKGRSLSWSKHRTEEERAQFLRDDPRTGSVESRRVFCRVCEAWIKLRNATTYCATPWLVHIARCTAKVSRSFTADVVFGSAVVTPSTSPEWET